MSHNYDEILIYVCDVNIIIFKGKILVILGCVWNEDLVKILFPSYKYPT